MSEVIEPPALEEPVAPSDYFSKIPIWNAGGQTKRFEVMADELSGRIPLIAQELSKVIYNDKVVDWEKREAVQAQMRTAIRVLLRKYGYPQMPREQVAEQLLSLTKRTDDGGGAP